jgi:hypothetical protein
MLSVATQEGQAVSKPGSRYSAPTGPLNKAETIEARLHLGRLTQMITARKRDLKELIAIRDGLQNEISQLGHRSSSVNQ